MSTFNITLNGSEFEGAKRAAKEYINIYDDFTNGELDPSELFSEWITTLLGINGLALTYGRNGWPVSLTPRRKIIATKPNGTKVRLRLVSEADDPANTKIVMITPAEKPDVNAPYLTNAVSAIKQAPTTVEAQTFLLGSILLKRCR